jgi:hypothetical protein
MQNVALVTPSSVAASHLSPTPEKHELELSEKNLLLHPGVNFINILRS